jgi:hypothetical protein
MGALHAEMQTSGPRGRLRMHNVPRCAICSDTMVAPEASVFKSADQISYLWSCDTCGLGFVTEWRSSIAV